MAGHWSKLWKRSGTLLGYIRAKAVLRDCQLGSRVYVGGDVRVRPCGGTIRVGPHCVFLGGLAPTRLVGAPGRTVAIGARSIFNYGTRIQSNGGDIEIGQRCLVASGVRIFAASGADVRIGDDVWIAHGVVLLPGVTIGDGAVVAAASVVSRDVPAGTLAIGNPARSLEVLRVPRTASRIDGDRVARSVSAKIV